MKISLLENGVDSLKKGYASLRKYENLRFLEDEKLNRFFDLKDAILSVHHGLEILFKQVLMDYNEMLVFSEIGKPLKKAYQQKNQRGGESVFEMEVTPHTVTLREAVERLETICGVPIREGFLNKVNRLEKYRNQIVHAEVIFNEDDLQNAFNGLIDDIDVFFMENLGERYSSLSGYSDLKEKYQEYIDALSGERKALTQTMIENLLDACNKCGISIGENEAKIINDIGGCVEIF